MKKCPKCGKQFSDGVKLCPFDRIPLASAEGEVPSQKGAPPAGNPQQRGASPAGQPGAPVPRPKPAAAPARPPASFTKRACGITIDGFLYSLVLFPFTAFMPIVGDIGLYTVFPLWMLLRDLVQDGQSPGKMFVGMRIESVDGSPVEPSKLIMRNITIAVPILNGILMLVGCLVMLPTSEKRRIGDRIAGTRVVDLRPDRGDTLYTLCFIMVIAIQIFLGMLVGQGAK